MDTQLFIEGYEVELTEKVLFLLNKQFEELSNPTIIINDWSKTVSVPFTASNNRLFGYIYRPDRMIISNGTETSYKMMKMYFDPSKKLDFKLIYNNFVLMEGYAKMNTVKQKDGTGTYELTLNGQLGKLFQEMLKITFDKSVEDQRYYIDGSDYVNETMNATLIKNNWDSDGQTKMQLLPRNYTGYSINDIIGFAPNNSFVEGFDHTSFLYSSNTVKQYASYFDENFNFETNTGMSADTVIPNGFLPREVGDFRSYLQLPYIYWNKLFQIFLRKAELLTGYTFDLDPMWFNSGNPYWYDLVYMLKVFNGKQGSSITNTYNITNADSNKQTYTPYSFGGYDPDNRYDSWHDYGYINLSVATELQPVLSNNIITIDSENMIKFTDIPISFQFTNNNSNYSLFRQNKRVYPVFEISLYNSNDQLLLGSTKTFGLTFQGNEIPTEDYNLVNEWVTTYSRILCEYLKTAVININLPYNKQYTYNDSSTYKIKIRYKFVAPSQSPVIITAYQSPSAEDATRAVYVGPIILGLNNSVKIPIEISTGVLRSGIRFTLNSLWNNDYNLFEQILNYCKIYRIIISVDNVNKKIIFRLFSNYFENSQILDWTDKVDMSKDFIVTPVAFDTKYIMFNYKDAETKIGKDYKEKYGVNYGEYKIATQYNFNTEKTELFKNVKDPIVNTDNLLGWINLARSEVKYSFPAEIVVDNKDKDKKNVDIFGTMFFYTGKKPWNLESALNLQPPYVSDDTQYMKDYSTYFYALTSSTTSQSTDYYSQLDIIKGDNMCVFNIPNESYTYNGSYTNKRSIYTNLWSTYLNERYNIQNTKVTCYLRLTARDWNNFKFSNFIKIDNIIYLVNKIYDYDITESQTTKVDLITVQNINAYKDDTFFRNIDILSINFLSTSYINGEIMDSRRHLGTFTSISDVTFLNGLKEYTSNGVKFIIDGNNVYFQSTSRYVDEADIDFYVTLKNKYYTEQFHCVRYSIYPYPEIKLYNSDGNTERNTINPGSRNYKLAWYGTETEGITYKPTVSIENYGTGYAAINDSTWTERQVMIQEGGDEWFRNEYVVDFNTYMTNYSGTYVRVIMVDEEGWHDTKDFPIDTDAALIYTLNSDGSARQSEDSVDYHGTSSTRGYKVYSNSSWTATLPQGVRSYGPTTGNSGTTGVTFDWGSGYPGTSKTITFSNTDGATCELVCTYINEDTIYTLNSDGSARQSEDSVEYHGTASTRGYKVYSTTDWTATLPQGVRSYGPTSGNSGTTDVAFDWGSGTPGTSKTITFSNTDGATCELVCHYVTE